MTSLLQCLIHEKETIALLDYRCVVYKTKLQAGEMFIYKTLKNKFRGDARNVERELESQIGKAETKEKKVLGKPESTSPVSSKHQEFVTNFSSKCRESMISVSSKLDSATRLSSKQITKPVVHEVLTERGNKSPKLQPNVTADMDNVKALRQAVIAGLPDTIKNTSKYLPPLTSRLQYSTVTSKCDNVVSSANTPSDLCVKFTELSVSVDKAGLGFPDKIKDNFVLNRESVITGKIQEDLQKIRKTRHDGGNEETKKKTREPEINKKYDSKNKFESWKENAILRKNENVVTKFADVSMLPSPSKIPISSRIAHMNGSSKALKDSISVMHKKESPYTLKDTSSMDVCVSNSIARQRSPNDHVEEVPNGIAHRKRLKAFRRQSDNSGIRKNTDLEKGFGNNIDQKDELKNYNNTTKASNNVDRTKNKKQVYFGTHKEITQKSGDPLARDKQTMEKVLNFDKTRNYFEKNGRSPENIDLKASKNTPLGEREKRLSVMMENIGEIERIEELAKKYQVHQVIDENIKSHNLNDQDIMKVWAFCLEEVWSLYQEDKRKSEDTELIDSLQHLQHSQYRNSVETLQIRSKERLERYQQQSKYIREHTQSVISADGLPTKEDEKKSYIRFHFPSAHLICKPVDQPNEESNPLSSEVEPSEEGQPTKHTVELLEKNKSPGNVFEPSDESKLANNELDADLDEKVISGNTECEISNKSELIFPYLLNTNTANSPSDRICCTPSKGSCTPSKESCNNEQNEEENKKFVKKSPTMDQELAMLKANLKRCESLLSSSFGKKHFWCDQYPEKMAPRSEGPINQVNYSIARENAHQSLCDFNSNLHKYIEESYIFRSSSYENDLTSTDEITTPPDHPANSKTFEVTDEIKELQKSFTKFFGGRNVSHVNEEGFQLETSFHDKKHDEDNLSDNKKKDPTFAHVQLQQELVEYDLIEDRKEEDEEREEQNNENEPSDDRNIKLSTMICYPTDSYLFQTIAKENKKKTKFGFSLEDCIELNARGNMTSHCSSFPETYCGFHAFFQCYKTYINQRSRTTTSFISTTAFNYGTILEMCQHGGR